MIDYSKRELLVHYVHCNFEAETHFCCCWCCPHSNSPLVLFTSILMSCLH